MCPWYLKTDDEQVAVRHVDASGGAVRENQHEVDRIRSILSFLVGVIKDLGFRRIILKCDNEPSTKVLQDAVIQAGVGVQVIPRGPPEGDHKANQRSC